MLKMYGRKVQRALQISRLKNYLKEKKYLNYIRDNGVCVITKIWKPNLKSLQLEVRFRINIIV